MKYGIISWSVMNQLIIFSLDGLAHIVEAKDYRTTSSHAGAYLCSRTF
jgi:hypothetical protein